MPNKQNPVRKAAIIVISLLAATAVLPWAIGKDRDQTPASSQTESLAAWQKIATVLQHPRCINCHQANVPLQSDMQRIHVPLVVRGPDNRGVSAMRCANCH